MKEKDLPIDRTRHAVYTKKAKKCVLRLLHRWYDDPADRVPVCVRVDGVDHADHREMKR